MTNTTALLQAIEQNPDDDTLKLIYADALQEDDSDPTNPYRAYYIRESIKYCDMGFEWSRFPKGYSTGFTVLPEGIDGEFSKGFCISISLTLAKFEEAAAKLFAREPLIRGVEFTDLKPSYGRGYWRWFRLRLGQDIDGDELPDFLFDKLVGKKVRGNRASYAWFSTAVEDLKSASLLVGKEWVKGVRK